MPTLYGFRLPQCFTKIVCGHPVLLSSLPDQRHSVKQKERPHTRTLPSLLSVHYFKIGRISSLENKSETLLICLFCVYLVFTIKYVL